MYGGTFNFCNVPNAAINLVGNSKGTSLFPRCMKPPKVHIFTAYAKIQNATYILL